MAVVTVKIDLGRFREVLTSRFQEHYGDVSNDDQPSEATNLEPWKAAELVINALMDVTE